MARDAYIILYPGLVSGYDAVSLAIRLGDSIVIIDSGSGLPASNMQLINGLIEAGLDPRRVEWLINTHAHIHNVGGDRWIRDMLHAKIAAHIPDSRIIEEGDNIASGAEKIGLTLKPTPVTLHVEGDQELVVGDRPIQLLHTPGHTPGSMSIIVDLDQRLAVIGDALGSLSRKWGSNEDQWWNTLQQLKEIMPQILCTSVKCYAGEAAKEFLRRVEEEGPVWVD
ncbi:MAG: MBL fold metallo-hydrolase [Desulfurococcales archaeon]|nr:MBL fold metallo-hydrolase [Desulfurococcales archaeon]